MWGVTLVWGRRGKDRIGMSTMERPALGDGGTLCAPHASPLLSPGSPSLTCINYGVGVLAPLTPWPGESPPTLPTGVTYTKLVLRYVHYTVREMTI